MSTLIWKEYRQNRRMFVAIGLFLLLPYAFCVISVVIFSLNPNLHPDWPGILWMASYVSLMLCSVVAAFAGGNMVAGERADRSSEFVAYLPIRRAPAITAKLTIAAGAIVLAWMVNFAILVLTHEGQSGDYSASSFTYLAATAVLTFGGASMLSCLIRSPGIATIGGLAAPLLLAGTLLMVGIMRKLPVEGVLVKRHYNVLADIIGLACICIGVVYYLRRVEP